MNLSKTGGLILKLRKEKGLTQKAVADRLGVCPKTVSKWERGRGFPDISLLSGLAEIFRVDAEKLIAGEMPQTKKETGNVKKTRFYVCETCGNLLTSMGDAEIVCCGRKLSALNAKEANAAHAIHVEKVEDEYYITFSHPMTKEHYISFVSYVRFDRVLTVRLYPEQDAALRFPQMRGGKLYFYCSTHGLYMLKM